MMKKLLALAFFTLPFSVNAEASEKMPTEAEIVKGIITTTFGEGDYAGTIIEKRVKNSINNVKGICGKESLVQIVLKVIVIKTILEEDGYFVTPLEIVEAIGTLKRQAPDGVDCQKVVNDYASVIKVSPTPAEALASVNSLYKILKKTKQQ